MELLATELRFLVRDKIYTEDKQHSADYILTFREYGQAVNFCIKKSIPLKMIEKISKNLKIEEICGRREVRGMMFNFPAELDYFCPICGKPPQDVDWEKDEILLLRLHYSEYKGFMWCENCNIDIPSFLCLKADSRKAVHYYTDRYLEFIKLMKEDAVKEHLKKEKICGNCVHYDWSHYCCSITKRNQDESDKGCDKHQY